MPNHCENQLYVSGPKPEITELAKYFRVEYSKRDDQILSALIPMPDCLAGTRSPAPTVEDKARLEARFKNQEITQDEFESRLRDLLMELQKAEEAKKETGFTNWYDWANHHWGTKWGDYDAFNFEEEEFCFSFGYHTAWGPFSDEFMANLTEKYPKLYFTVAYLETNMDFMGAQTWNNGFLIDEVQDDTQIEGIDMEDHENYYKWDEALRNEFDCMIEHQKSHHPYPKEGWRV